MATKSRTIEIGITSLQLNPENPRLSPKDDGTVWDQASLLAHFAARPDVRDLAKDIAQEGTNPSKRLIVEPLPGKNTNIYKVLEGNRRVAALRLLREPALAGSEALARTYNGLRDLAPGRLQTSFEAVVLDFEQAKHWLEIEHAKGQGGRATVGWGSQEHSRFSAFVRGSARHGRSLALLDLLKERGLIDAATFKKVPITTLDRIVGDKDVRKAIGWTDELPPLEKAGDVLHRIVKDLAEGMRVQRVFDKKKRKDYIEEVKGDPSLTHSVDPKTAKAKTQRSSKVAADRKALIPSSFVCKSTSERIKELVKELKNLHVDGCENVVAIAMRTLFELSMTEYIDKHKLVVDRTQYGFNMAKGVPACCKSMISRGKIDKKALSPVLTNWTKDHSHLSLVSFHGFVHDKFPRPTKRDLVRKWDEAEPFFDGAIGASR